jgi:primosomal protein N' (replication factor Y)
MEQVSGRAGRKDGKGKVLVQVSNTRHPVLEFVKEHNFNKLFNFEIDKRKQFGYPPFTRLIQVTFKHREKHIAEEAANIMLNGLKTNFGALCSGPAQPLVDRVRNQYLWEILVKLPKNAKRIEQCKKEIAQQMVIIQSNKRYRSVTIIPDVDPV